MSLGNERVRATFNPGGHTLVGAFKLAGASFIDMCAEEQAKLDLPPSQTMERNRCYALAMTKMEEAAMWAVKAATFGK